MKRSTRVLVKDGQIDRDQMRRAHMSQDDLLGALRSDGVRKPAEVKEARLERSGDLSVIKADGEPRVLEAKL